ncbi:hypothetical protein FQN50_009912 [Emmonsiellopsis sp. PD_5]|nr:hypothetical protein FQN50_009912 [Emmonsiellopsis sp. PD_5]
MPPDGMYMGDSEYKGENGIPDEEEDEEDENDDISDNYISNFDDLDDVIDDLESQDGKDETAQWDTLSTTVTIGKLHQLGAKLYNVTPTHQSILKVVINNSCFNPSTLSFIPKGVINNSHFNLSIPS